jgi:hypothetical protein
LDYWAHLRQREKLCLTRYLRGALADGPVAAKDVERIARDHGISPKGLRTAREDMAEVKITRDGFGPGSKSLWSLAPYLPSTPILARQNNRASMDIEGQYGELAPAATCLCRTF